MVGNVSGEKYGILEIPFQKCRTSVCDKKLNSRLLDAILFVQDIPTAACVSGNGFV